MWIRDRTNTNSNTNIPNNNLNNSNTQIISDAKAKEIALNHANVSQNQVSYINAHLDYDDGIHCLLYTSRCV